MLKRTENEAAPSDKAAMLHQLLKLTNRLMAPFSTHLAHRYKISLNEFRLLMTIGALGITAWLWMVWAVIKQRRWARPAATTLFVLASGLAVANLTVREYGQTILPTQVGLVGLLPCLAGLAAVTLLWMRERR